MPKSIMGSQSPGLTGSINSVFSEGLCQIQSSLEASGRLDGTVVAPESFRNMEVSRELRTKDCWDILCDITLLS